MEFAVAIAGFSGITMAIQSRERAQNELITFRNKNLITFSLSAAFASALPQVTSHLGAAGTGIWVWSSSFLSLLCAFCVAFPYAARRTLPVEQRIQLSRVVWYGAIGGTTFVLLFQWVNALGYLGEPAVAPLYIGILWMILVAAVMYFRMLFSSSHTSAA
jgi:hypothetical protein